MAHESTVDHENDLYNQVSYEMPMIKEHEPVTVVNETPAKLTDPAAYQNGRVSMMDRQVFLIILHCIIIFWIWIFC